jgi:ATP-dependent metalloprotease FtsH
LQLPVVEYDPELVDAYSYALASADTLSQREVGERISVSQATIGNWRSGKHEPRGLSSRFHVTQFPETVIVTPALMKLLGYYTAEGRNNGEAQFCFDIHEKSLIADCIQIIDEVFGLDAKIEERLESNSVLIHTRSAAVGRFFESQCGNGSHNKHVPTLLWTLPREYFLAYLDGYVAGDGYMSRNGKRIASSVSQRLIRELVWLCAMHGVKCGVGHEITLGNRRAIRTRLLPSTESWKLIIGKTNDPLAFTINKTPQEKKSVVRSVVRKPYDGYVYDLCGCDNEAFFGGEKPILLHNSRVRDLFSSARKQAPAIVFIDEIDSIGRKRGAGLGGGHDEREQTLNQILSEMDGFDPSEGVVVISATNRPDILDPALLRPGRFDRQVVVPLPDLAERIPILQVHCRDKRIGPDVDLEVVARGTPGMSGADLANLVNEAALQAVRRNALFIEMQDFDSARDRVLMGQKRESTVLSEAEKERVAFHEAGHAVLSYVLPHADPLLKVSIIPTGMALGVTQQLPLEDKHIYRREYIEDSLCVRSGGRVAEAIKYRDLSTGASDDLQGNTELARRMVREWGMSDRVGPMAWGSRGAVFLGEDLMHTRDYSEDMSRIVDEEVSRILREQEARARKFLELHLNGLKAVAQSLLEHETIDGTEVARLINEAHGGAVHDQEHSDKHIAPGLPHDKPVPDVQDLLGQQIDELDWDDEGPLPPAE